MTLTPHTRFGPYTLAEAIGVGGMGEVYRATDTNLKRDVAIKVLPESFAADADRLARFQREAEVLASLNHPNIAQIYGLEKADNITALVMELIEGPTLADRLEQGPIPAEEAIAIAMQIIEALSAAHERGIVHRDLKPANLKLKPDGTLKVLDFGIAKISDLQASSGPHEATRHTPSHTETGIVLGTAAYMSPEQARGKTVDQHADIWAFGCVLYEMLTGQAAFGGEDVSVTLARILERGADLNALPPTLAPAVKQTIVLCLEKDVRKRVADIRDVKLALAGAFETGAPQSAVAATAAAARGRRVWVTAFAVALLAVVALAIPALQHLRETPQVSPSSASSTSLLVRRTDLGLGQTEGIFPFGINSYIALSRDGGHLVYLVNEGGTDRLYHRALNQLTARSISNVADARALFFSPDGEWVGFTNQGGGLFKIALSGGQPLNLIESMDAYAGCFWSEDDVIYFSMGNKLHRIPAVGGDPEPVNITTEHSEWRHGFPYGLPVETHILLTVTQSDASAAHIALLSLATGETRILIRNAYNARYVSTGHIVFMRSGSLWAVPFDVGRLESAGAEVPVIDGVETSTFVGVAGYTFSDEGLLIYLPGEEFADLNFSGAQVGLLWVDREGKETPLGGLKITQDVAAPQLSPDGKQVAVSTFTQGTPDVWTYDIERDTFSRRTFSGNALYPLWTPDGERLVYGRVLTNQGISWTKADGTGQPESLMDGSSTLAPKGFTPDGSHLVIQNVKGGTLIDLDILPMTGERNVQPLLATEFVEATPAISPDGHWMAYASNETGRNEVYVRPFPDVESGKWQISTDSGTEPRWRRDGKELFFLQANYDNNSVSEVDVVAIDTNSGFQAGKPEVLFKGDYLRGTGSSYDVTADGQRFIMLKRQEIVVDDIESQLTSLVVVENWFEELKRLAPPAK